MNNHYIPQLLLKQFAVSKKVNIYDFHTLSFSVRKLKNTFASKGIFDQELEKAFAVKLEGPFGNLLNHRLLTGDTITINRTENLLMRKFLMINSLRSPLSGISWDEMVQRTKLWNHPSVQMRKSLIRNYPGTKEIFNKMSHSKETYIPDLKKAMEIDSLEDIADAEKRPDVSEQLRLAARNAIVTVIAFWDSSESGQEFIFPKLPGICQMDDMGILYKSTVIYGLREEMEKQGLEEHLKRELDRIFYGNLMYCDNFSVYPLSPTRAMICIAPYFRAFFPIMDPTGTVQLYPPFLDSEQFDRHFFEPMRMELFRPCRNAFNRFYQYRVMQLKAEEVQGINAMILDMETEEFVFHDYNKIRDSFWYYDKRAIFADKKKHDFSCLV